MQKTSQKVLVLFAHPALQKSHVNRRLINEPQAIEGVYFHDLYEEYPRFDIDVPREQQLLAAHDVVVFQHPVYWYSTPSILKEWQDLVLEHGWAYGSEGKALQGKCWLHAVTTGGTEDAYCAQGQNHFTIRQLLAPLEQTALLCGMRFLPPFVIHGAHGIKEDEIDSHARDYRALLTALVEDRVEWDSVANRSRLNADLALGINPREED